MKTRALALPIALAIVTFASCLAQTRQSPAPAYFLNAAKTIGAPGKLNPDGSFVITITRTDVRVLNTQGMPVPADLGLSTYAAFYGSGSKALVVGEMILLSQEIDDAVDALRAGGIEILALYNHMTTEEPRMFHLHFKGEGSMASLSAKLAKGFAVIGKSVPRALPPVDITRKPVIDWAVLQQILKEPSVLTPARDRRFLNPRTDLKVKVGDLAFTPGMGVGSWAAFHLCTCGRTIVEGDTCCSSPAQVQSVIDALRKADLSITGIHNHVFGGSQELMFVQFDAEGDAVHEAVAIRTAWDALGKP